MRLIVTSIGTSEGKTFFARGVARALSRGGHRVAALKPFETGVGEHGAVDARSLERAARAASGAFEDPAFFRASSPVSPLAAVLGGAAPPDLAAMQRAFDRFEAEHDVALIESAGGLFVPIAPRREGVPHVFAELVRPADKVLLLAGNRLGVLSHVIAAARAFGAAGRTFDVILRAGAADDASTATNAEVLRAMGLVVHLLADARDDDDALADAVGRALPGLTSFLS